MKERLKKPADRLAFIIVLVLGFIDLLLQTVFRSSGLGMENRGVSFGALKGVNGVFLIVIWLCLVVVLVRRTIRGLWVALPLWLMVVGGAVNLLGRLSGGGVWDYIQIPYLNLWFNISDMMITLGLGLFIFWK